MRPNDRHGMGGARTHWERRHMGRITMMVKPSATSLVLAKQDRSEPSFRSEDLDVASYIEMRLIDQYGMGGARTFRLDLALHPRRL